MTKTIRIGTRGSQLALIQAETVRTMLLAAHPEVTAEIVPITTSGEWRPEQGETRLSEAQGGKGLFAREIEQALLGGQVDCGVHSLKDMASFLPEGLALDHMLPREDPRDAFLSPKAACLEDLPAGAVVGTASLRRQALVKARRPDIEVVPLRGNVPTRIEKLKAGQVDAAILAYAGLKRLGLGAEAQCVIDPELMLPAACQGIIAIETRLEDSATRAVFDALHCHDTGRCGVAERAVLQVLDGSCHTPIGAYAVWEQGGAVMYLRALVAAPDGSEIYHDECRAAVPDAAAARTLGEGLGRTIKARLPAGFLA